MTQFILWYLLISLVGLLAFPLAYRLLPGLADRGYGLSRALGLLLWGYVFWVSTSLGFTRNNPVGLFMTLLVFAALSMWIFHRKRESSFYPGDWLRQNTTYLVSVEVLFLLSFAFLAFMRSYMPEAVGTEKPMELAFINAVLNSATFPPHDPWLSGYGISYYYFGYVMTGMMAKLTATSGGVAFNLMLALIFALSAIGAYSLLYNLLLAYWTQKRPRKESRPASLAALFGPLFLLLVSNWEGFLEILHRRGIGWTFLPDGTATGEFWTWLKMKDLSVPPTEPLGWVPARFWWWWRAARVLHDYDLQGAFSEVIDEFPAFSYLLGDLHPHVLAMPFGLLAVSLALNLLLGGGRGAIDLKWFKIPVSPEKFILLAFSLGGLAFINTWDLPVYLALNLAALILLQIHENGWDWERAEEALALAIPLGLSATLLYLPFYISFDSQAGGILPNVIYPVRGAYLWIMFGPLLALLFALLAFLAGRQPARWALGFSLVGGLALFLWLLSLGLGIALAQTPVGVDFITAQGETSLSAVFTAATLRRLEFGGSLLTLILLAGAAASYLLGRPSLNDLDVDIEPGSPPSPLGLVLVMILFGGLLVLAPEFIYLRDFFGGRMNTIFKFYYQAWALWSLACAFGVIILLTELREALRAIFVVFLPFLLTTALVYPVFGFLDRTNRFQSDSLSLDAGAYFSVYFPDDYQAVQFLKTQELGILAEAAALNTSYNDYARIATHSGFPNVLGWMGHESQWRGGYEEMGSRYQDLRRLYETSLWDQARQVIDMYNIRYVYIGGMERYSYRVNEEKFAQNLVEIYRQGDVVIYKVP
jgi:YYY domain-containing protein